MPTLLSLGFKHNSSDNSYSKTISNQFSIEVDESGKLFLVADAEETGIAGLELTEEVVRAFSKLWMDIKYHPLPEIQLTIEGDCLNPRHS